MGRSPLIELGQRSGEWPRTEDLFESRAVSKGGAMFTTEDAAAALAAVGVDISDERYGLEDVRDGMNVELEHGTRFPDLDVSGDDPVITVKIALAHLREFPDYYERLEVMERDARLPGRRGPGTDVEVG